jgi:ribokinase
MSVCVLGSINADTIMRVSALPLPGQTIAASDTTWLPGGKGGNQAVASMRMGVPTQLIGAVGNDADGARLMQWLTSEGVDVRSVIQINDALTGAAYITLDAAGENQIIVAGGANLRVTPEMVSTVTGARVVLAQLETPVPAITSFFARAGEAGALRILNAGPASVSGVQIFPDCDVIVVNQTELAFYCQSDDIVVTPEDALVARTLLTRAGQRIIVTLGGAGAVEITLDTHCFVPARQVAVVDTTGAGDCFCGVLAAILSEGFSVPEALGHASIAASICVGRTGAAPAMPMRKEVDDLLDDCHSPVEA